MVCPFCLHEKTSVYNSRRGSKLNVTWRRRQCEACGSQFTTYESAEPSSILTIKDGVALLPYSHHKLLFSVMRAFDHRSDLDESAPYICSTIEQKLYRLAAQKKSVTRQDIILTTAETLRNYDPVAYVAYIGRHQANVDAVTLRQALKRKK